MSKICTYAFFCCTSDTAYWKLFENTVGTSCNTFHCPPVSKLTMGSEIALPIDKSIFFQKKCLFSCVCAFFVVPLHAFLRVCALVCMHIARDSHEKKAKLMFNFLTYGYYRVCNLKCDGDHRKC